MFDAKKFLLKAPSICLQVIHTSNDNYKTHLIIPIFTYSLHNNFQIITHCTIAIDSKESFSKLSIIST